MAYVWAARPAMAVFAVLLCLAGVRLSGNLSRYSWVQLALYLSIIFLAVCATMLYNDFCDRDRDKLKGKTLASDNPAFLAALCQKLWIVVGLLTGWVTALVSFWAALQIFAYICIGINYARFYRIPCLALVSVAVCSAGPAALGLLNAAPGKCGGCLVLLLCSMTAIASREIIKDIEDVEDDRGYKATLPVLIGVSRSRHVAAGVLYIFGGTVFYIDSPLRIASVVVLCAAGIWPLNFSEKKIKLSIDVVFIIVLSRLLFWPL